MSADTPLAEKLTRWGRLRRLQRAVYGAFRGLLIGVVLSGIVLASTYFAGRLMRSEAIFWLGIGALIGLILGALSGLLRTTTSQQVAHEFDRVFDLKERASTALELQTTPRQTPQILIKEQYADTLQTIADIKPRAGLRWQINRLELAGLLLTVSVLGLAFWLGGPKFEAAQQYAQTQELIQAEIDNLALITKNIQTNPELSPAEQETLLQPLEDAITTLEQAESVEEALSVLNEVQEELVALADANQPQFEGLQQAGEALEAQQDNPLSEFGEELAEGDLAEAADALENLDLDAISAEGASELSEQLSEAAESLAESNPALAEQLQQAAEALAAGEMESAAEALDQASGELSETLEELALSESAAEAAQSVQLSTEELMRAAGLAEAGASSSTQAGSGEQPGEGEGSSGAGRGEFEEAAPPGSEVGLAPIEQNNSPGDGGENNYDSVYAPQLLGGDDNFNSGLDSSETEGNTTIGETGSTFEEEGSSSIPYSEVFPDYEAEIRAALESGEIPPALRPIIREYFSSLAP